MLVAFVILYGCGYGGLAVLRASIVRDYFGRNNFGTIVGLLTGLATLGLIVGPLATGWVYDNWGSYQNIWLAFAALIVVAFVLILTVSPVAKTVNDKT